MEMKRVAVVAKTSSREAIRSAHELVDWLRRRDVSVFLDESTKRTRVEEDSEVNNFTLGVDVDLVVVLGGDGTMLSVARSLPKPIPVLGVNLGRLGFLTEVARSELYPAMVKVLAGNYEKEERALFKVRLERAAGSSSSYFVLNDAVISKSALARIVELRITIDDYLVGLYRADGLIVSTPTGSTAYNLSADGPIVSPSLPVAVITPICPHTLSARPLVVPDHRMIEITLETPREEVYLTLDGQEGASLSYRDKVQLMRSEKKAVLVKVEGHTFYENLRRKLGWGEPPA